MMQKRGDIARREAKLRALSLLLSKHTCSSAEFAAAADVSRPTAYSLADELCDAGLLRRESESRLALERAEDFILLKLYEDAAELVTYTLGRTPERIGIPFVPSMEYSENVMRAASAAERYADERVGARRPRVCAIFSQSGFEHAYLPMPKLFLSRFCADGLICEEMKRSFARQSVLYADFLSGRILLIYDGKCLSSVTPDRKGLISKLAHVLELCPPDIFVFRGAGGSKISEDKAKKELSRLCALRGVKISLCREEDLLPDEKEAVLQLLSEKITAKNT